MSDLVDISLKTIGLSAADLTRLKSTRETHFAAIFHNFAISSQTQSLFFYLSNGVLELTSHSYLRGLIYFEEINEKSKIRIIRNVKVVIEARRIRINDAHEKHKWYGMPPMERAAEGLKVKTPSMNRIIQELCIFLHECSELTEFDLIQQPHQPPVSFEECLGRETINIRFQETIIGELHN